MEDLTVKLLIFFLGAVLRRLSPKRIRIIDSNRAFYDF